MNLINKSGIFILLFFLLIGVLTYARPFYVVEGDCNASGSNIQNTILRLSSLTNAHVAKWPSSYSSYAYSICFNGTSPYTLEATSHSCGENTKGVLDMSNAKTNAHAQAPGYDGPYDVKVCYANLNCTYVSGACNSLLGYETNDCVVRLSSLTNAHVAACNWGDERYTTYPIRVCCKVTQIPVQLPGDCAPACSPGYVCQDGNCIESIAEEFVICNSDSDCLTDESCSDDYDVCLSDEDCGISSDCPSSFECSNSECIPEEIVSGGPTNLTCGLGSDFNCTDNRVGCYDNTNYAACFQNRYCFENSTGAYCTQAGDLGDECDNDYECRSNNCEDNECAPECEINDDCDDDEVCNTEDGVCEDSSTSDYGESCSSLGGIVCSSGCAADDYSERSRELNCCLSGVCTTDQYSAALGRSIRYTRTCAGEGFAEVRVSSTTPSETIDCTLLEIPASCTYTEQDYGCGGLDLGPQTGEPVPFYGVIALLITIALLAAFYTKKK